MWLRFWICRRLLLVDALRRRTTFQMLNRVQRSRAFLILLTRLKPRPAYSTCSTYKIPFQSTANPPLMISGTLCLRHLGCWAERAAQNWNATINVRSCRLRPDGHSVQLWVEILADDRNLEGIKDQIQNETVDTEIIRVKEGKAFGLVMCSKCIVAHTMRDLACTITSQRVNRDGSVELQLLASGREIFRRLVDGLRSRGIQVEVLGLTSSIDDVDGGKVTARQEQIIRKALELGYYDYPRRIRQKKLASACGISSSTLSELLRRAERNMIVDRGIRNAV
jgi:predicted DNA binding protein